MTAPGLIGDVAALYVDPRGPYPSLVEHWWDEKRDARTYDGPHPVVCHPPCGPWSSLRHLWTKHQKDLAPIAVEQVRKWGGVLEHPATSTLFDDPTLVLPHPGEMGDGRGWTVEVEQCNWGHPARKRTWLYCVGIDPTLLWPGMRRGAEPTHWCSGVQTPGKRGKPPAGIRICSAQQRRRTPPDFARWLISLAQQVRK